MGKVGQWARSGVRLNGKKRGRCMLFRDGCVGWSEQGRTYSLFFS